METTYTARFATENDIPVVIDISGNHRSPVKRLTPGGQSYHPDNRVLIVEKSGEPIGTGYLIMTHPAPQLEGHGTLVPQLKSLCVKKAYQSQGAGTFLIRAAEEEVLSRGLNRLFLSVAPKENPGALRLYERLGFEPLSGEVYESSWTYKDLDGVNHEFVEWLIDMVKVLR